ncbi:MAG: Tat pathway signal sequence domain protein [Pseudomonadota bacterium]
MRAFFLVLSFLLMSGSLAISEEQKLSVELNKLEADGNSCQAFLVLQNGTKDAYERFVLDLVMFDADGIIARRLAVDIAPLDAGKLAVKVFAVPEQTCDGIGRVLVNGVLGCQVGGAKRDNCLGLVATSSRAGVDFIN